MPAIKKQVIDEPVPIRAKVRESVWKRFKRYSEYMNSSWDYCVEQALESVLNQKDKAFADYEAKYEEQMRADEKKRSKPAEIPKAS